MRITDIINLVRNLILQTLSVIGVVQPHGPPLRLCGRINVSATDPLLLASAMELALAFLGVSSVLRARPMGDS